MRVAYIINSLEGGGAAAVVPKIASLLRRHGGEIRLFALTRRDGRGLAAIASAGINVVVREGGERDHLSAFRWLYMQIARSRPDLLWTSLTRATILGQLVGLRRRLPVVSWQHSDSLKPLNLRLLRSSGSLSALWIGDSEVVTKLTRDRMKIPPHRLATLPPFIADDQAPLASSWRSGEPVRIGSLGRLHWNKGYDTLLTALSLFNLVGRPGDFTVEIAGDGPEWQTLNHFKEVDRLDNLIIGGHTARPIEFLRGLHLYVQPSRSEGFCVSAHEAMQAGLPVIATSAGELPNTIIDGVTGFIVPPNDPSSLLTAIQTLVQHPERLSKVGLLGRERLFERFSEDAFTRAGDAVVERIKRLIG